MWPTFEDQNEKIANIHWNVSDDIECIIEVHVSRLWPFGGFHKATNYKNGGKWPVFQEDQ